LTRIAVIFLGFLTLPTIAAAPAGAAEPFTIQDAILQAVRTHPGVGEAAANRRATDAELRQQQGTLLPQVRLEARTGYSRFDHRDATVPLPGNDQRLATTSQSVVVRQLLFDGFASLHEIWRQAARVDAAAARVFERTELIALDAVEAYVDVIRYQKIVNHSMQNLEAHRRIAANVRARFQGGRAGEGDLEQVLERVAQAEASLARYRQSLDEARAMYRRAIGLEPFNLREPRRLSRLPKSREEAQAIALTNNPTIKAARADADAEPSCLRSRSKGGPPAITTPACPCRAIAPTRAVFWFSVGTPFVAARMHGDG
jgi:adhesin transport system outer membrane protein